MLIVTLCSLFSKRAKSAQDRATVPDGPSTSTAEPVSFYAVAQAVDETNPSSEVDSPLNPHPLYAVVKKEKRKVNVVQPDESSNMMNDIVNEDGGDVLVCENDIYNQN